MKRSEEVLDPGHGSFEPDWNEKVVTMVAATLAVLVIAGIAVVMAVA